jgi:hypothetical protein
MYEFVDRPELWTDIINRDCAPVQLLASSSLEDLKQYYRYHRKTMVPASHFTVLHYRNSTYLWNDETRVKKASNQWHYLLLPDPIHVKNPSSIVVACIHGAYGCMKRGLHLDFVQFVNV